MINSITHSQLYQNSVSNQNLSAGKQLSKAKNYTAAKFIPTNRNNPCPVCEKTNGNCRTFPDSDLVLCMTGVGGSYADSHWDYIKDTKDGQWGTYVPKRDSWQSKQNYHSKPKKLKPLAKKANPMPAIDRDREYRKLLASLPLHPLDKADLIQRGLNDHQIESGLYRSVDGQQKLTIKVKVDY
jgi:hypothetical protein